MSTHAKKRSIFGQHVLRHYMEVGKPAVVVLFAALVHLVKRCRSVQRLAFIKTPTHLILVLFLKLLHPLLCRLQAGLNLLQLAGQQMLDGLL